MQDPAQYLKAAMRAPLQVAVALVDALRRARSNGFPCDFDGHDAALALLFAGARMLRLRDNITRQDFEQLAGAMWTLAGSLQDARASCSREKETP